MIRTLPSALLLDRLAYYGNVSIGRTPGISKAQQLEKMQREMDKAIANEAYERAAELRDQIKSYQQRRTR